MEDLLVFGRIVYPHGQQGELNRGISFLDRLPNGFGGRPSSLRVNTEAMKKPIRRARRTGRRWEEEGGTILGVGSGMDLRSKVKVVRRGRDASPMLISQPQLRCASVATSHRRSRNLETLILFLLGILLLLC